MSAINDDQIEKLLDDIASIKSVIRENKPLLQQMLLPVHFRVISILSGFAIIAFSVFYHIQIEIHGSYASIPGKTRATSLALLIGAYVLLAVLKRIFWMRSLKKRDSRLTFRHLVKTFYSFQLFHVWLPTLVMMLFISGLLIHSDQERYIVPTIALCMGLLYNMIGSTTRIKQYIVTGYWMIITGVFPFFFFHAPALLVLAISMGGGMLLFTLISVPRLTTSEED